MASSLLPETILDAHDNPVPTSSIAGGVLGLYFSAHWCPPCRGFTPVLAKWYQDFVKNNPDKKLNIVFVSSDRSPSDFTEYHKEMGFHALPFDQRDKKTELSKKFKVSGIPTLVFVDENGNTLSKDGRRVVSSDPEGKGDGYPWAPKTFTDIVSKGAPLINNKGEKFEWSSLQGKHVSIYFSAHWCGPCRGFTPQLVKTYNAAKAKGLPWEVIFASSDRDEQGFDEYFGEMPWLALPFEDPRIDELSSLFEVDGIPTLVLVDPAGKLAGKIVTTNLRDAVDGDPEAAEFPWPKKAVGTMRSVLNDINEVPTLLALVADPSQVAHARALFQAAGDREIAREDPRLAFGVSEGTEADLGVTRRLLQLFGRTDATLPVYALVDISERRWFELPATATSDAVLQFVDDFAAKKLPPIELS